MATLGTNRILSVWSHVFWISENGNRHDGSQCWKDSHLLLKQDITPFTTTFGERMARWVETTFWNVLPKSRLYPGWKTEAACWLNPEPILSSAELPTCCPLPCLWSEASPTSGLCSGPDDWRPLGSACRACSQLPRIGGDASSRYFLCSALLTTGT